MLQANYNFFNVCVVCKEIIEHETIRCGACVRVFCRECVSDKHYNRKTLLLKCPSCGTKTRAQCTPRFIHEQHDVVVEALMRVQRSQMLTARCANCDKDNAPMRCVCALSTRYCNRECQTANWHVHKKYCTSSRSGRRITKILDWFENTVTVDVTVLRNMVSPNVIFSPVTCILILNRVKAIRAQVHRMQAAQEDS